MTNRRRKAARTAAVGAAVVGALFAGTLPSTAGPMGGTEVAVPFEPRPLTESLYDIRPPDDDPGYQRRPITASNDGTTSLFIETWLPIPRDGNDPPPEKIPTVLSIGPFTPVGVQGGNDIATIKNLVTRGYAYTQAHVRGSHGSYGCWDRNGGLDQSDAGDIIESVAAAPWSNGTVGLYGISNPGASAVAAAGLADPKKTKALKAVVAGAPVTSLYEFFGSGGVTPFVPGPVDLALADVLWSTSGDTSKAENRPVERQSCLPDRFVGTAPHDGNFNDFVAERELRRGAANITVPVLVTQGFDDPQVNARSQVGFFDEIPDTTPKVGVFGLFGHEWPDGDEWEDLKQGREEAIDQKLSTVPGLTRADWQAMVLAWFDRYLKGIDTGVEDWPTVQIQDNEGQWRAQDDWPSTDAPTGQLALGLNGQLGAATPVGGTSYVETAYRNSNLPGGYPPGTSARFEMPAKGRLELTGQPVVDLWVELDRPDAHIAATLEAFDAAGQPIPYGSTTGFRSAQHLDPYVNGRFEQREPRLPAFGIVNPEPVHVIVPLEPRDIVVPAGGKLVLTIAGSASWRGAKGLDAYYGRYVEDFQDGFRHPSQLSGSATRVNILHGCDKLSALRFQMPDPRRKLLNVLEDDEMEPLRAIVVPEQGSDGAGAASRAVCGRTPPPMTAVLP